MTIYVIKNQKGEVLCEDMEEQFVFVPEMEIDDKVYSPCVFPNPEVINFLWEKPTMTISTGSVDMSTLTLTKIEL